MSYFTTQSQNIRNKQGLIKSLLFRPCLLPLYFCLPFLLACQSEEELKREKYFVAGQQLYKEHCSNCHQTDGKGLAALYPPINGSDYLRNKEKVICLIRHGLSDSIVVNGRPYNRPMPANPQLANIEVAEIVTYIYNEWGNEKTISEVKDVGKVLDQCVPQTP
ncbi:c-type cytochrome [Tellurirhabdus bombi]|uniref:c-type cytochrome n=1 Tax=Tellurirhabdus bombi TaxID=2907205 RepID=UPI001F2DA303|nr:cytochrome c [Tellurirhabdus bombi]